MKLLRATCDCGFATKKVRSGYHYDQWWFPIIATDSGELTDIVLSFPASDRERITNLEVEVLATIPHTDKAARREAFAKVEALSAELHATFISRERECLRARYDANPTHLFDPPDNSVFLCPQCSQRSLVLARVRVLATCKPDCGNEYEWLDTEQQGCPKCGHRPHVFQTEVEDRYAGQSRTICCCPCSSTTNCISHADGFCPKCGGLADSYFTGDDEFCGKHHERMLPYHAPGNLIFMEPIARWVADLFPNAKLWGDAAEMGDVTLGSYCASCESDHRRWLELHADDAGREPTEQIA